jgi:hypothetical protein
MAAVPTHTYTVDAPIGDVVRYFPAFWDELRESGFWQQLGARYHAPVKAGPATMKGKVAKSEVRIGVHTLHSTVTFSPERGKTRVVVEGDLSGLGASFMVKAFMSNGEQEEAIKEAIQSRIGDFIARQKEAERGDLAV